MWHSDGAQDKVLWGDLNMITMTKTRTNFFEERGKNTLEQWQFIVRWIWSRCAKSATRNIRAQPGATRNKNIIQKYVRFITGSQYITIQGFKTSCVSHIRASHYQSRCLKYPLFPGFSWRSTTSLRWQGSKERKAWRRKASSSSSNLLCFLHRLGTLAIYCIYDQKYWQEWDMI